MIYVRRLLGSPLYATSSIRPSCHRKMPTNHFPCLKEEELGEAAEAREVAYNAGGPPQVNVTPADLVETRGKEHVGPFM
jgi:hypothetical protein